VSIPLKPHRRLAYRINEVAAISGLCRSQIYNLMRDGKLPFVEVGHIRLIHDSALRKLLKIEEPAE
jgi:excisionase family DNA binding protein